MLWFLLLPAFACALPTFYNVELEGYSIYRLEFNKTITGDTLNELLPENTIFDHLKFKEQNIPILTENSISDIASLDELTIERCGLKEIQPGAFRNLSFLRKVVLNFNELEHIKEGVFNNLTISQLLLRGNHIQTIDETAFDHMANLLHIDLGVNNIEVWNPKWFQDTPLLNRVTMSNNSLSELPRRAFINLRGTKKYSPINLVFTNNKISQIDDDAFDGLENINNLWIDYNELSDISENVIKNVNITSLSVSYNNITCLHGDLSNILKAQTLDFDGNPWECTCLEEIKKWTRNHGINFQVFVSDLECNLQRLAKKVDKLNKRVYEVKGGKDVETVTISTAKKDEVEILFK